ARALSAVLLPPLPSLFPYPTRFRSNALSCVMEDTPADVDFRAVNEGYTESSGTFSRVTEPLVICGGDIDVDRFIVKTSGPSIRRSEEHTSELQSRENLVCRLPLEKK